LSYIEEVVDNFFDISGTSSVKMAEPNEDTLTSSSANATAALTEEAVVAGDRPLLPPIYFRVGINGHAHIRGQVLRV